MGHTLVEMNARLEMLIEIRARLLALQPPRRPVGAITSRQWREYDEAIAIVDDRIGDDAESVVVVKAAIEQSIARCRELRKSLVTGK